MLLAEGESYRYDTDQNNENKGDSEMVGEEHSLDALRYLTMSLDRKRKFVPVED
jgi:hypothetical protein